MLESGWVVICILVSMQRYIESKFKNNAIFWFFISQIYIICMKSFVKFKLQRFAKCLTNFDEKCIWGHLSFETSYVKKPNLVFMLCTYSVSKPAPKNTRICNLFFKSSISGIAKFRLHCTRALSHRSFAISQTFI